MKDDFIYISHILDAINDIKEFAKDMNKKQFLGNKMAEHAIVRNIEILGEASKNLSKDFRGHHKEIPWQDIIKMRNKVTHFYFGINYEIVWQVVQRDIPALEEKLKAILKKQKQIKVINKSIKTK